MYDLWYRLRAKSKWSNKIHTNNGDKRWRKRNPFTGRVVIQEKNLARGQKGIQKALINQQKDRKNVNTVVKVEVDKFNIISYVNLVPGYEP